MSANGISLFLSMITLVFIAILARIYFQSWQKPGAFFPLMIVFYFLIPLVIAPSFYVFAGALWWVSISTISFCCGCILVSPRYKPVSHKSNSKNTIDVHGKQLSVNDIFRNLKLVLVVSIVLGFLSSVSLIWFYGYSLKLFTSAESLSEIGNTFSAMRYGGSFSTPLISQILLVFCYLSAVLGGTLYAVKKSRYDSILSMVSLLPALTIFLVQTTRAAVLYALVLWLTSFLSLKVLLNKGGRAFLITRKNVLIFVLIVISVIIINAGGSILRIGEVPDKNTLIETLDSPAMKVNYFGHVSAFSRWFQETWYENINPALGANSFAAFFNITGLRRTESDVSWPLLDTSTNITTVFSALIKDYTFGGSLLFLFFLGIVSSYVYYKVASGSILLVPLLGALYMFMAWLFYSGFRHNVIIFSFLLAQIYYLLEWLRLTRKLKPAVNQE